MANTILDILSSLAPVLSSISAARGRNQDTNTILGQSNAAVRPGIVGKNLTNSMRASMFGPGYTPPKLNWGGPGSVVKGNIPTYTGGPAPLSQDTTDLQSVIEKDALAQAQNNYGLKDPSATSAGDAALGGASTAASILGALSKVKGLTGSGGATGSATTPYYDEATGQMVNPSGPAGTGSSILDKLRALLGSGGSGGNTGGAEIGSDNYANIAGLGDQGVINVGTGGFGDQNTWAPGSARKLPMAF